MQWESDEDEYDDSFDGLKGGGGESRGGGGH